jgi:hypothetical protein
MMVREGRGAVCTCSGRVLQIINLPVNQPKKNRSGYYEEKWARGCVCVYRLLMRCRLTTLVL